jgi:hypothetical protein
VPHVSVQSGPSSHATAFASNLRNRLTSFDRNAGLLDELLVHIRALPLPASSTLAAKQDDFDRIGTELWNLCTRLRRDEQPYGNTTDVIAEKKPTLPLIRVFAFLLLDTANGQAKRGRERKNCFRLMKIALKAARVCIDNGRLDEATKVLERAAEYQEALSADGGVVRNEEAALEQRVRIEYFAVRTTLVSRLQILFFGK